VIHGSNAIYFGALYSIPDKEKDKEEIMGRKLIDMLNIEVFLI
jgi:hypothetical protein